MSLVGDGVELLKLIDKGHNASLYKQLGEWIDKVLTLQKTVDDQATEIRLLKEQVRFKASLQRLEGHTFVDDDLHEICPRCAEVDLRASSVALLRLQSNC